MFSFCFHFFRPAFCASSRPTCRIFPPLLSPHRQHIEMKFPLHKHHHRTHQLTQSPPYKHSRRPDKVASGAGKFSWKTFFNVMEKRVWASENCRQTKAISLIGRKSLENGKNFFSFAFYDSYRFISSLRDEFRVYFEGFLPRHFLAFSGLTAAKRRRTAAFKISTLNIWGLMEKCQQVAFSYFLYARIRFKEKLFFCGVTFYDFGGKKALNWRVRIKSISGFSVNANQITPP